MQSTLEPSIGQKKSNRMLWVKWAILGAITFICGYGIILMYAQKNYAFALLTLVLTSLGVYIFASEKRYSHRYIYPGVAGMILFIIFPLLYTVGLAFTNYSGENQLNFERAQTVLLQQTYQSGDSYKFDLMGNESGDVSLVLHYQDRDVQSSFYPLNALPQKMQLEDTPKVIGKKLSIKAIIADRDKLKAVYAILPNGESLVMSGLRKFAQVHSLYQLQDDGVTLINQQSQDVLKPNFEDGFYQKIENGQFVGEDIAPGFIVNIGWDNFKRIFTDKGIQEPFFNIFIWTVVFSTLAVALTAVIGMVLACVVQWEALKGRGIYRVLLILPYAVPGFISILVFKGLFNQSFGEINALLEGLFGIKPLWFTDPFLAKMMIVIVNTWLGFPYMMILCMGLLKAIPEDLYEASAMDGAGPMQNFIKITFPLLIKPLKPLMIASFAFNFNNFVLIDLLTKGGPDQIGTSIPAGHTDLLVNFTYRVAFEGSGGQQFGLAGAIATIIFILVAALSIINLKFSKTEAE